MTPDEKELLMRTLKLSEDNNRILIGLQRSVRWQAIWSLIKVAFLVIPLVVGYIFLQPYLNSLGMGSPSSIGASIKNFPTNLKGVQDLLNSQ